MNNITTSAIKALVKSYDEEYGFATCFAIFSSGDASINEAEGTRHMIKYFENVEEVYADIKYRLFPKLTEGQRLELIAHETGNYFMEKMIQKRNAELSK